jgi:hypothetical protein
MVGFSESSENLRKTTNREFVVGGRVDVGR